MSMNVLKVYDIEAVELPPTNSQLQLRLSLLMGSLPDTKPAPSPGKAKTSSWTRPADLIRWDESFEFEWKPPDEATSVSHDPPSLRIELWSKGFMSSKHLATGSLSDLVTLLANNAKVNELLTTPLPLVPTTQGLSLGEEADWMMATLRLTLSYQSTKDLHALPEILDAQSPDISIKSSESTPPPLKSLELLNSLDPIATIEPTTPKNQRLIEFIESGHVDDDASSSASGSDLRGSTSSVSLVGAENEKETLQRSQQELIEELSDSESEASASRRVSHINEETAPQAQVGRGEDLDDVEEEFVSISPAQTSHSSFKPAQDLTPGDGYPVDSPPGSIPRSQPKSSTSGNLLEREIPSLTEITEVKKEDGAMKKDLDYALLPPQASPGMPQNRPPVPPPPPPPPSGSHLVPHSSEPDSKHAHELTIEEALEQQRQQLSSQHTDEMNRQAQQHAQALAQQVDECDQLRAENLQLLQAKRRLEEDVLPTLQGQLEKQTARAEQLQQEAQAASSASEALQKRLEEALIGQQEKEASLNRLTTDLENRTAELSGLYEQFHAMEVSFQSNLQEQKARLDAFYEDRLQKGIEGLTQQFNDERQSWQGRIEQLQDQVARLSEAASNGPDAQNESLESLEPFKARLEMLESVEEENIELLASIRDLQSQLEQQVTQRQQLEKALEASHSKEQTDLALTSMLVKKSLSLSYPALRPALEPAAASCGLANKRHNSMNDAESALSTSARPVDTLFVQAVQEAREGTQQPSPERLELGKSSSAFDAVPLAQRSSSGSARVEAEAAQVSTYSLGGLFQSVSNLSEEMAWEESKDNGDSEAKDSRGSSPSSLSATQVPFSRHHGTSFEKNQEDAKEEEVDRDLSPSAQASNSDLYKTLEVLTSSLRMSPMPNATGTPRDESPAMHSSVAFDSGTPIPGSVTGQDTGDKSTLKKKYSSRSIFSKKYAEGEAGDKASGAEDSATNEVAQIADQKGASDARRASSRKRSIIPDLVDLSELLPHSDPDLSQDDPNEQEPEPQPELQEPLQEVDLDYYRPATQSPHGPPSLPILTSPSPISSLQLDHPQQTQVPSAALPPSSSKVDKASQSNVMLESASLSGYNRPVQSKSAIAETSTQTSGGDSGLVQARSPGFSPFQQKLEALGQKGTLFMDEDYVLRKSVQLSDGVRYCFFPMELGRTDYLHRLVGLLAKLLLPLRPATLSNQALAESPKSSQFPASLPAYRSASTSPLSQLDDPSVKSIHAHNQPIHVLVGDQDVDALNVEDRIAPSLSLPRLPYSLTPPPYDSSPGIGLSSNSQLNHANDSISGKPLSLESERKSTYHIDTSTGRGNVQHNLFPLAESPWKVLQALRADEDELQVAAGLSHLRNPGEFRFHLDALLCIYEEDWLAELRGDQFPSGHLGDLSKAFHHAEAVLSLVENANKVSDRWMDASFQLNDLRRQAYAHQRSKDSRMGQLHWSWQEAPSPLITVDHRQTNLGSDRRFGQNSSGPLGTEDLAMPLPPSVDHGGVSPLSMMDLSQPPDLVNRREPIELLSMEGGAETFRPDSPASISLSLPLRNVMVGPDGPGRGTQPILPLVENSSDYIQDVDLTDTALQETSPLLQSLGYADRISELDSAGIHLDLLLVPQHAALLELMVRLKTIWWKLESFKDFNKNLGRKEEYICLKKFRQALDTQLSLSLPIFGKSTDESTSHGCPSPKAGQKSSAVMRPAKRREGSLASFSSLALSHHPPTPYSLEKVERIYEELDALYEEKSGRLRGAQDPAEPFIDSDELKTNQSAAPAMANFDLKGRAGEDDPPSRDTQRKRLFSLDQEDLGLASAQVGQRISTGRQLIDFAIGLLKKSAQSIRQTKALRQQIFAHIRQKFGVSERDVQFEADFLSQKFREFFHEEGEEGSGAIDPERVAILRLDDKIAALVRLDKQLRGILNNTALVDFAADLDSFLSTRGFQDTLGDALFDWKIGSPVTSTSNSVPTSPPSLLDTKGSSGALRVTRRQMGSTGATNGRPSIALLLIHAKSAPLLRSIYASWPGLTVQNPTPSSSSDADLAGNLKRLRGDRLNNREVFIPQKTAKPAKRKTSKSRERPTVPVSPLGSVAMGQSPWTQRMPAKEVDLSTLTAADFSSTRTLRLVGFSLTQLRDSQCFGLNDLLLAGYPLQEIRLLKGLGLNQSNMSLSLISSTSQADQSALLAKFSSPAKRKDPDAALPIDSIPSSPFQQPISVRDLKLAGYSVEQCLSIGYDAASLRAGGFNDYELLQSGQFSEAQLKRIGCNLERFALMSLYEALDGKHWRNQRHWGSSKPIGMWYGVKMDGAGRVCKIDLRSNFLTGQIPEPIALLENLEVLDLGNNQIHGALPDSIQNLTKLRAMWLTNNPIKINKTHFQYLLPNCRLLS